MKQVDIRGETYLIFPTGLDAAKWIGENLPEEEWESSFWEVVSNRRHNGEYKMKKPHVLTQSGQMGTLPTSN